MVLQDYGLCRGVTRLQQLEWPERVQAMQTNWIGRSTGATVIFKTEQGGHDMPIFTTRPDTLWGATFMVLALSIRWWQH